MTSTRPASKGIDRTRTSSSDCGSLRIRIARIDSSATHSIQNPPKELASGNNGFFPEDHTTSSSSSTFDPIERGSGRDSQSEARCASSPTACGVSDNFGILTRVPSEASSTSMESIFNRWLLREENTSQRFNRTTPGRTCSMNSQLKRNPKDCSIFSRIAFS